ncbi:Ig-like domain-containing protein [Beggiatoa leptomitoformis]|uniref:Tandem-95 repeat protein n=1 Tax=Beggiatoa leptomitoformis TaxID=288004 RepID=A0A2N9YHX0_9GAMM|nr:Ig-like domain-containing protein [Beggiatoa leptomitoformis]ALG67759.1 tandem-95 repeat protein [Beggiatoa leptomitoformis]AUI69999.1 tandem-95 repeat protein [Beggiatoa leptomitoformis]
MAKQVGIVTTVVDTAIKAVGADGSGRILVQGDPIYEGDTIETGKRAYIKITLTDGTLFQLGPLSKASLDKFNYQPEAHHGELETNVFIGFFRFISGKIGGDERGQHTTIKTPSATIGIRGSELDMAVNEHGDTTVLHISGLIDISPLTGDPFTVYVTGTRIEIPLTGVPFMELASPEFINGFRAFLLPLNPANTEKEELLRTTHAENKEQTVDDKNTDNANPNNATESLGRNAFTIFSPDAQIPLTGALHSSSPTETRLNHAIHTAFNLNDEALNNEGVSNNNTNITSNDALLVTVLEPLPPTPPTVDDDANQLTEDYALITPVLFSEPELIRADTELLQGSNGFVFNNQDGSFTYQPNAGFSGTDTFAYRFTSTEPFIFVEVNVSRPQVIMPNIKTGDELPIKTNAGGDLLLQPDGTVDYIPPADFHGTDSFSYLPAGQTEPVTIVLTVAAMNDAPQAVRDHYNELSDPSVLSVAEDSSLTIPASVLLANDIDVDSVDGDSLSIYQVNTIPNTLGSLGTQGAVVLNADNSISFQPTPNFNGETEFTYVVQDNAGVRSSTTVRVNVTAVNDAPLVVADTVEGAGQASITIPVTQLLSNDSDIEAQPLVIIGVDNAENGVVTLLPNGMITFTPAFNFSGGRFEYIVSDGQAENSTSRGVVTITAGNTPDTPDPTIPDPDIPVDNNISPIATNDGVLQIGSADSVLILGARLLANDSDPNGDVLTITSVNSLTGGTATLDNAGNILFSRSADFTGNASFTYTISDGRGGNASAIVSLQGDTLPVNLPPVAVTDNFSVAENSFLVIAPSALLSNDTDPEGQPLNIASFGGASNGTLTQDAIGNLIFTPTANFVGNAQFTYNVSDGVKNSTATVQIQVLPLPDEQPQALNDTFSTPHNTPLEIASNLLLNNDIPAQSGDILQVTTVSNASNGTVQLTSTGTVLFTPTADFSGLATFNYTISDTQGKTSSASVTVDVMANQMPIAVDDADSNTNTYITNQSLTLNAALLLANDSDPDGDTLQIVSVGTATHGTVALDADGNVIYTPETDYNGTDQFTYTIDDGQGATASATVSVFAENAPPVAVDDLDPTQLTTAKNQAIIIPVTTLLANDSDPDNDPLTVIALGNAVNGQVLFALDGSVSFTPDVNFVGTAGFQYSIGDGKGKFDSATVAVTVVDANSPPVATPDTIDAPFNQTVFIASADLLSNDNDPDSTDVLQITQVIDNPDDGVTVKLLNNNEIQLFVDALASNQFESVRFNYILSDGQGHNSETTVTVESNNVTHGTAVADNLRGTGGDDIILGLGGNDTFQAPTGNDIFLGGTGDDLFLFDPSTVKNAVLRGEEGQDTLKLVGSQSLDLLQNSSLPAGEGFALTGIDVIDLRSTSTSNSQLRLSVQDVLNISDNNRLMIEGNAQSFVVSNDGWTNSGVETIGTASYNRYTAGGAELLVNTDIGGQFIF